MKKTYVLLVLLVVATFTAGAAAAQCGTPQHRSCWGRTTTQKSTVCGDHLHGGSGADTLAGWDGRDVIEGGYYGDDRLCGENDNDLMFGGAVYSPGYNTARMTGGSGDDVMYGTNSGDYMNGEGGNDKVYGLGGHDYQLQGSHGNDTVDGGSGSDWVEGNGGWDYCYSGIGNIGCEVCPDGTC